MITTVKTVNTINGSTTGLTHLTMHFQEKQIRLKMLALLSRHFFLFLNNQITPIGIKKNHMRTEYKI